MRVLLLITTFLLAACTPGARVDVRRDVVPTTPPTAAAEAALEVPAGASNIQRLPPEYEAAPALELAAIDRSLRASGIGWLVRTPVPIADYYAQFDVRTNVGNLRVSGRDLLAIRLAELDAVRALDKITASDAFVDAAERGVARPVEAVTTLVDAPGETLSNLPRGIGRYLVRTARRVGELAVDLADASRDAMADDDEKTGHGGSGRTFSEKAQSTATSASLRWIGYHRSRREIARHVGVDPYSTNPLLDERLDRLAWADWTGRKLVGFGIGAIGGIVGEGLSISTRAYELAWELPPEEIRRRNIKALEALGVTGKPARDLLRNRAFPLTLQIEFVDLIGAQHQRHLAVEWAALGRVAEDERDARFLVLSLRMAADIQSREPGARGAIIGGTPGLIHNNGQQTVLLPVDHIHWSDQIAAFAWRDDLIGEHPTLVTTGTLSELARESFSQAGWTVIEHFAIQDQDGPVDKRSSGDVRTNDLAHVRESRPVR